MTNAAISDLRRATQRIVELERECNEMRREVECLEAALVKYGRHGTNCLGGLEGDKHPCGLDAAKKGGDDERQNY